MPDYKIKKQVCLGRDPSGKRIRKWFYGRSDADINRQVREYERQMDQIRNPSNITFKGYADKWFATYKAHKAINTQAGYKNAIAKCKAVYNVKLHDLCKTDLQQVINANVEHPETCRKLRMTLEQIFDAALDDGIVAVNPAAKLEIPKKTVGKKRALTAAERKAVKTVKLRDADRLFLDLLYYCGLRRGEALALTRADFDFKGLLLTVNKSIAFNGESPTVKDTKTHTARQVPIPKAKAKAWKRVIGDLPFAPFAGYSRTVFRGMWRRIEAAVNAALGGSGSIKAIHLTPHMLRHDYATRLYYVPGISTKKKASILGHSEKIFLEIYSHMDDGKEVMDTFQAAMDF